MKKIIIVNNNMKIGGVQKSLYNLLWSIYDQYDITLYLFSKSGEYIDDLPPTIKVISCNSLFRYLGVSQGECKKKVTDRITRGLLALLCKIWGRPFTLRIIEKSQKVLPYSYDIAISYLQNGSLHSFYGGVNEFVLKKINAKEKIAFLHCDYGNCGANNIANNKLYDEFDKVAACSYGCLESFLKVMPELHDKCFKVRNFHRNTVIKQLASQNPVIYESNKFHIVVVARLAHEKAIDRAIKAVAYGITQQLPLCLHIVGDGNMMESLKDLTVSLKIQDNVYFYRMQDNPYRFMINADLLMITSYHEAAPMVIDEAYIVGLPVLTVETTSSEEMVLDRHCGWICENSQEGINRCLVEILKHVEDLKQMKRTLRDDTKSNEEAFKEFYAIIGEHNENNAITKNK